MLHAAIRPAGTGILIGWILALMHVLSTYKMSFRCWRRDTDSKHGASHATPESGIRTGIKTDAQTNSDQSE